MYMMNSYKNYTDVLRCILKNFNDNQFDDIIKNILIKIFDIYYLKRGIQQYNIDNVKLSECQLFSGGDSSEIDKIPELFFKKRNLIIMKNLNDNKCLLYCYIRKHLNPITTNLSRVRKKDIEISKKLIDEFNIDFENVSIGEIDEIEGFLECNIHIFGLIKNLIVKNY